MTFVGRNIKQEQKVWPPGSRSTTRTVTGGDRKALNWLAANVRIQQKHWRVILAAQATQSTPEPGFLKRNREIKLHPIRSRLSSARLAGLAGSRDCRAAERRRERPRGRSDSRGRGRRGTKRGRDRRQTNCDDSRDSRQQAGRKRVGRGRGDRDRRPQRNA